MAGSPTSLHQFEIPIHLPTFYVQQSESLWTTTLCAPLVPTEYCLAVASSDTLAMGGRVCVLVCAETGECRGTETEERKEKGERRKGHREMRPYT